VGLVHCCSDGAVIREAGKGIIMNFNILFLAICVPWILSEVILLILARSRKNSVDRDEGSIVLLNATIYLCVALGVSLGFLGIGHIRGYSSMIPWLGLWLIVIGLIVRWVSILTLRKYFTTNVVIQNDHRIIQSGIYKFVRHPSYSGSILSFLGLGVVFVNWLAIIILVVPITVAFIKRIKIEERALENAFGEEYREYCKSTWLLFPWL
jgi:protein-S-isoprenylcysteine O-methyltransferase Ste14